jgi:hypothetical protein
VPMRFGRRRGTRTESTRTIGSVQHVRSRRRKPQASSRTALHGGPLGEGRRIRAPARHRGGRKRPRSSAPMRLRTGTILVGYIARSGPSQTTRGRSGPGSPDHVRTSFPDQLFSLLNRWACARNRCGGRSSPRRRPESTGERDELVTLGENVQCLKSPAWAEKWIPAFAGMTMLVLRIGRAPD